jgi:predicted metal-binding protein
MSKQKFVWSEGDIDIVEDPLKKAKPEEIKIGIIICDRYRTCAGGKCFRALCNREGAFSIYGPEVEVEVVGYTTCDGCPGGNIEYAPAEMVKNGARVIHLATGLVVGYPPCPYLTYFRDFIQEKYGVKVVIGTHPIPQKYFLTQTELGTWKTPEWEEILKPTLTDEKTRLAYD